MDDVTYILYNPRHRGCANVYVCKWNLQVIDKSHSSHDVLVGDVEHDGAVDIGRRDIAFAEQDQSPTRRVGVFYNVNGDGSKWKLQILALNGGHNIKAGILGHDRRPSILTARHGYFGGANPLIVWLAPSP